MKAIRGPWWALLTTSAAALLLSAACDSPGGGGGGVVVGNPCLTNPTLPICQAQGDATGNGGDVKGPGDVAGVDLGPAPDYAACTPQCGERECGDDGCGGSCGFCGDSTCNVVTGLCEGGPCIPACDDRQCGDDLCGGSCGTCGAGESCNALGQCEGGCTPSCSGKECGGDGCGGTCASCPTGYSCQEFTCVQNTCIPNCSGKQCGNDGCGSVCGTCSGGQTCNAFGQCEGGSTGDDCGTILDCVGGCADETCMQGCLANGSAIGQSEFMAYNQCLGDYSCQDAYCLADNCAAQAAACFYDSTGSSSCYDVLVCQNGCSSNQACLLSCVESGTATAQAQLTAVNACIQAACPAGDQACVEGALSGVCAAHWSACSGGV